MESAVNVQQISQLLLQAQKMTVSALLHALNEPQQQAVSTPAQSVLVLAGAGSGKTKVLVHRIAWKIQVDGLHPHHILAVTFTNKAANEMRERLETLLNRPIHPLWIGTFHGLAHRLLRYHSEQAHLPPTFQVMDSEDQLRLIKRLLKSAEVDEKKFPPRTVQGFINAQKDEGLRAASLFAENPYQKQLLSLYQTYEAQCYRSGLVDFAELLLRAHELLRDNPPLLQQYQQRFKQVLVDEFQDTNTIQYAWLRLLTGEQDNLFIVGDDDQSIYGWRGAKIENMQAFQRDYPQHLLVKLEQNYRSRGFILKAANALIAENPHRIGKNLWTTAGDGDKPAIYTAFNEQDEAYFVIEKIKQLRASGIRLTEMAILYRSNAQSRLFEERLMTNAIPYRIYGGLRFFERAEIKHALAYLRLVSNRHDDASFDRVVNFPTRGIGAKTLEWIAQLAKQQAMSLWQAAALLVEQAILPPRASLALKNFLLLIKGLSEQCENLPLYEKVNYVIENSGLQALYQQEKDLKDEGRLENLAELVNAARLFDYPQEEEHILSELDLFLTHASLEAGEMQAGEGEDYVQLMTLHSAKGLEFNTVFLVGLEEGLFPSQQSLTDPHRLEEERRLCYVGITRAMHTLFLTHAESRRLYGQDNRNKASRFLNDIPADLLEAVRLRTEITQSVKPMQRINTLKTGTYQAGQKVSHAKFGEGVVLQSEGEGAKEKVQVNFKREGIKWLMLSHAKLTGLDSR
jgi:DNA helicase-2/ATP-dependent DNA helicase PcrA